jgi:transcriptional regulator
MYVHTAFKMDEAEAIALLRQRGFGLLVLSTPEAPIAAHVPFLVTQFADGRMQIELHVARANSLHGHIGSGCKALLVCQGPDAFISPDWYGIPNQVPTWTYLAVHVTGTAKVLPAAANLAHVDRLSAEFEERLAPKKPWSSGKMDETRRSALLSAIVSIAIDFERIEGQKKLIQHKGQTEHRGAIAGLQARGDAGSLAIADLMQEAADRKFGR